jgi:PHD/YefM family antitoxin component YafN of YafNO toxin-antitoxin module
MIDITTDIRPVSDLRTHAAEMMDQIARTGRPIILTKNGKSAGVLAEPGVYDNIAYKKYVDRELKKASNNLANGARTIPAEDVYKKLNLKYDYEAV